MLLAVLLLNPAPAAAEPGDTGKAKKEYQWKIDDFITTDTVEAYHISPSGKQLVWTVRKKNLKTHADYHTVYLTTLDKKSKDRQLTRRKNTCRSIQWVPGEAMFSFKTDRKFKDVKPGNLWVMPLTGGEPYPVTSFEKGVEQYVWLDARRLLFTSMETDTLQRRERKKSKDTSIHVEDEDHPRITRLFMYDLESKKTVRLTRNVKPLYTLALSRDKKHLVYLLNMSVRYGLNQQIPPKYYLLNLETKESKEILAEFHLSPNGRYEWDARSRGFYFGFPYNSTSNVTMCSVFKAYYYDLKSGTAQEVDLDWDRYLPKYRRSLQVTPDGFLAQLADGARYKFARFRRKGNGWKREWIAGDKHQNIQAFAMADDGKTLVYTHSTASQPHRFYLAKLKGNRILDQREVMDIKSPLFKKPLAKTEVRTWKGALDDTIEGILYYPIDYQPGKKYPLMLMIHGGPNGADMDAFEDDWINPTHYWCERGMFVLKPNYHGSSNYGIAFGESIAGHYYEYEVPDIEAGVDMLINEGKVDKEKMGIIGLSNGAILGTALLLNSPRYKAASLSAGDVNWISDYGNCPFGVAFDDYYLGGPPWENLEYYIKISPLFQLKKIRTPVLIFHGDKDQAVPFGQGWEFYRAMQVIGQTPVKFLVMPGEPHVLQKLAHRRRKMQEELVWFETHLFKNHTPRNESLKKGSPLENLEKLRAIAAHDGRFGLMHKDRLLPETVTYKKMEVGRFEITRAQWAAFDVGYQIDPGAGNFPAVGITFEKARAYTAWLSKLTGKTYRLPDEKEAKSLYTAPGGNTFDYWAGYAVNPDDYANLRETLKKYGDHPVLLKPVGRFPGKGKQLVFDLGGNAAEWVTVKNGKGKAFGGSAVMPADPKSDSPPPPAYTGFRVILEAAKIREKTRK